MKTNDIKVEIIKTSNREWLLTQTNILGLTSAARGVAEEIGLSKFVSTDFIYFTNSI